MNRRKYLRIAELFAQKGSQYSQLVTKDQPNVYMLNAKQFLLSTIYITSVHFTSDCLTELCQPTEFKITNSSS